MTEIKEAHDHRFTTNIVCHHNNNNNNNNDDDNEYNQVIYGPTKDVEERERELTKQNDL